MNNYYNYIYLDPSKAGRYIFNTENRTYSFGYLPFYVGKGTRRRFKQHLYKASGRYMKCKLISLNDKGVEPIILIINKNSTNEQVCKYEKFLIKLIGRKDLKEGSLCNHTDGGEDGGRQIVSLKTREYMSKLNKGKKLSEEHKIKIGLANKGKISNKTLIAHKEFMKVNKDELYGKKVYKIKLDGTILKEYNTIRDAALDNNVKFTFVQDQCRHSNRIPRFVKFKFRYK